MVAAYTYLPKNNKEAGEVRGDLKSAFAKPARSALVRFTNLAAGSPRTERRGRNAAVEGS